MAAMRNHSIFLSALLLFLMFGYLLNHFPQDDFWYDETVSGYLALESWDTLWEWTTEIDIQPPLYFSALNIWSKQSGTGEFELRYFSLLAGFLGLAGMMQLGKRVSGSMVAGWGASVTLLLCGGFLYAYGEARTYALVMSLAIWSLVWMDAALQKTHFSRVFVYSIITIAALYAHYTAVFLVVAQGLYVVWHERTLNRKFLIFLLPGLSYLPWVIIIATNGAPEGLAFEGVVPLERILKEYWEFFLYGQVVVDDPAWKTAQMMAAGLAVLALFLLWQKRLPLLVLLIGLFPIFALTVSIRLIEAKLSGRHGWALWIGVALLVGVALHYWLEKWKNPLVHVAAIGILAFLWVRWPEQLPETYPSHLHSAFQYIEDNADPDDFLILRDGSLYTAAEYYETPLEYVGFPDVVILNVNHHLQFIEAQQILENHLLADAPNIWIVSWAGEIMDPQELTYGIAEYIGGLPKETIYFGDVHVSRYENQRSTTAMLNDIMELQDVLKISTDGPSLLGVDLIYEDTYPNCPVIFHAWWWRGERDYPDSRISYRLLGPDDTILAQYDFELSGQIYPQKKWLPFVPTLGRADLRIPQGVDKVTAAVVVYDLKNAQPPQFARLEEIPVTPGNSPYCDYVALLPH